MASTYSSLRSKSRSQLLGTNRFTDSASAQAWINLTVPSKVPSRLLRGGEHDLDVMFFEGFLEGVFVVVRYDKGVHGRLMIKYSCGL